MKKTASHIQPPKKDITKPIKTTFNPYKSNPISTKTRSTSQNKQQPQQQSTTTTTQKPKITSANNPWAKATPTIQKKKSTFGMIETLAELNNIKIEQNYQNDAEYSSDNNNKNELIDNLVQTVQKIEQEEKQKLEGEIVRIRSAYPLIDGYQIEQNTQILEKLNTFFSHLKVISQQEQAQDEQQKQFYSDSEYNNIEDPENQSQYVRIPFEYRKLFLEILKKYGVQGQKCFQMEDFVDGYLSFIKYQEKQSQLESDLKNQVDEFQELKNLIYKENL